ncbi:MAG: ATP phosphoribosyltransferase regulatory subunit [Pseudomonadota bacterium]
MTLTTKFKSHAARARIEKLLEGRGAELVGVDLLQPAEPFLDTAGDELRRRIFMARGINGRNVCLRPEFTIPVCLSFLESGKSEARQAYVGEVFRQGRIEGMEFLQAGIEDLGQTDRIAADVGIIKDAVDTLRDLGPTAPCSLTLGDQAVFDAVLRALELPLGWRIRLVDAFGDPHALAAQLVSLAAPTIMPELPPHIAAIPPGDQPILQAAIADDMDKAGLPQSGGRTAQDIASRLTAKISQVGQIAAPERVALLEGFLAINEPLSNAAAALAEFAVVAGIRIDEALEVFNARVEAMQHTGLDLNDMNYAASFGRSLDYYTGMVFEIRDATGAVLVGGGRYDRLLELLGAPQPVPGVGFSLWLDRLAGDIQ